MIFALLSALSLAAQAPRDSVTLVPPREAIARVAMDFGDGPPATMTVRNLEVAFSNSANVSIAPPNGAPASVPNGSKAAIAQPAGSAQVRFTKDVNVLSMQLAQHGVTGAKLPTVTIDVLDTLGVDVMRLSLGDVVVSSDRVVLTPRDQSLDQQRLSLVESITQLQADVEEAERQLSLTDALDKRKLSSSQEVARARERVELLQTRLANQRQRLAMLERQIASQSPLHEEVVLTVGRFDIAVP